MASALERSGGERWQWPASSDELLRGLTEASPVGAFVSDAGGSCLFVNARWCELAGLGATDALGDGWSQALHPDDRDRVLAEWAEAGREARESVVEYRFVRPDGSVSWVEGSASPLRDAGGRLVGWAGTCVDVSRRRRREEQHRLLIAFGLRALAATEPQALLADAVETAAAGVGAPFVSFLERSTDGALLPAAAFGWSLRAIPRRPAAASPAGRALRHNGPVLVDDPERTSRFLARNGVRCSASVVVAGQLLPFGVLTAHSTRRGAFDESDLLYLGSVANVVSAALLREQAAARARHLAAIVRSSVDAIISRRLDGTVTTWNAAAERLFGYGSDEIVGRSVACLYLEESLPLLDDVNRRVGRGEDVRDLVLTCLRKDGTLVEVELTVSPIRTAAGGVSGVSTIARDVGERRALEEQLRQSQKLEALGALAGGVAHDFNNLLTVILGHAELIGRNNSPPEKVRWRVGEMAAAAEQAASLTRQLLAYSRKQMLRLERIDLNAVARSTNALLERLIEENVRIELALAPRELWIEADHGQIVQTLTNLVVNARDAMPDGGTITITTRQLSLDPAEAELLDASPAIDYAELTVADTGVGMDDETARHAFDPFFTTKPAGAGTGLGLSTVYGIVRQSRGRLRLETEPGRGTSLRMYFPVVAPPAAQPDAGDGSVDEARRYRILLVEDNDAIRAITGEVLADHGHTLTVADNAADALAALESDPGIDLVVSDIVMPGMSGTELAAHALRRRPELKVILTTGYSKRGLDGLEHDDRVRLLVKPFTNAALMRALGDLAGGT